MALLFRVILIKLQGIFKKNYPIQIKELREIMKTLKMIEIIEKLKKNPKKMPNKKKLQKEQ